MGSRMGKWKGYEWETVAVSTGVKRNCDVKVRMKQNIRVRVHMCVSVYLSRSVIGKRETSRHRDILKRRAEDERENEKVINGKKSGVGWVIRID